MAKVNRSRAATADDPLRGLEPTCRDLGQQLLMSGFAYLDLPLELEDRRRTVIRARGFVLTLQTRMAPTPVGGMVVNRDAEGDGPYFMVYAGDRPDMRPVVEARPTHNLASPAYDPGRYTDPMFPRGRTACSECGIRPVYLAGRCGACYAGAPTA